MTNVSKDTELTLKSKRLWHYYTLEYPKQVSKLVYRNGISVTHTYIIYLPYVSGMMDNRNIPRLDEPVSCVSCGQFSGQDIFIKETFLNKTNKDKTYYYCRSCYNIDTLI